MGQLTDGLNALIRYSNEITGASDGTISAAVHTLCEGYGQGGGGDEKPTVILEYNITSTGSFSLFPATWVVESVEVDGVDNGTSNGFNFTTTGPHFVKVVKPDGIIPDGAFTLNKQLVGVVFEGVWEEVGKRAFIASGLEYVKFSHTMKVLRSDSFSQLPLTRITPDFVTIDLSNSEVLENYSIPTRSGRLRMLLIGDKVTSLGGPNGIYDSPLTQLGSMFEVFITIWIGSGLTEVYGGLFDRCYIGDMFIMAPTPPTFVSNSGVGGTSLNFQSSIKNIYVPNPDLYKAAAGWSDMASIIKALP